MKPVPVSPATPLRRVPVQRRGTERPAGILDACAVLLDEVGYDALSARAVGRRAGVPIGSVRRFFGHKRERADASARRNLEHFARQVTDRLKAAPAPRVGGRPWTSCSTSTRT